MFGSMIFAWVAFVYMFGVGCLFGGFMLCGWWLLLCGLLFGVLCGLIVLTCLVIVLIVLVFWFFGFFVDVMF